jgi:hypothetical protein
MRLSIKIKEFYMIVVVIIIAVAFSIFCVCDYMSKFHPEAWKAWVKRNIVDEDPYDHEDHSIGRY